MNFVCSQCAHRQEADAPCGGCGNEIVHDLRERRTRDYLRELEMQRSLRLEGRIRSLSVAAAMVLVFLLWSVPGYWHARRAYFALPILLDQWLLMGVIAYGLMQLGTDVMAKRKRFPFVVEEWEEGPEPADPPPPKTGGPTTA